MWIKNIEQVYWDVPSIGGDGGGGGEEAPSTASIIQSSIEGLGGGDEGEIAAPPAAAAEPPAEPNEEQELAALQAELIQKNPGLKNGRIGVDRHQAVLTRARNQHQKEVEAYVAKEKAWAEQEAKYKAYQQEWEPYQWAKDPEIAQALRAIELAGTDHKQFAELLLQDPTYANLLQFKEAAAKQPDPNRPRPNQRTADGQLEYYDDDGVMQLLDWHGNKLREQVTKELKEQVLGEINREYGKMKEEYTASTTWNEAMAQSKVKLDSMRETYDGFKDFENEIKAEMLKPGNEKMTVEQAYVRVVPKKLQEQAQVSEETLRKKILAEMKAKPAAAQVVRPQGGVERVGGQAERTTLDAIRESIAKIQG